MPCSASDGGHRLVDARPAAVAGDQHRERAPGVLGRHFDDRQAVELRGRRCRTLFRRRIEPLHGHRQRRFPVAGLSGPAITGWIAVPDVRSRTVSSRPGGRRAASTVETRSTAHRASSRTSRRGCGPCRLRNGDSSLASHRRLRSRQLRTEVDRDPAREGVCRRLREHRVAQRSRRSRSRRAPTAHSSASDSRPAGSG